MNPYLHDPENKIGFSARKKLASRERVMRARGEWGAWQRFELPNGLPGSNGKGWTKMVRAVVKNDVFAVMVRPVNGGVHLMVSSLTGDRPSWPEMQRIKDDLLGADVTAVEIYPPKSEVIDEANAYHLWAGAGLRLPSSFSIHHAALGADEKPNATFYVPV